MLNKTLTATIVAGIIIFGFGVNYLLSNQKNAGVKAKPESATEKQLNIKTQSVKNVTVNKVFEIGGRVSAYNKIDLYSEVTGILMLSQKPFREGTYFSKGSSIIRLDDEVFKNSMLSQKSDLLNQITLLIPDITIDFPNSVDKWNEYLNQFEFKKPLQVLPETDSQREKNYIASRNIFAAYYNVKSLEATLSKYAIRAPFDGVVTATHFNPGSLIQKGQKIGEFTNTSVFELDAIARFEDLKFINVGKKVKLFSEDLSETFTGKIQRINSRISPETQSINVFIMTRKSGLKDGMYIKAIIEQEIDQAVELHRSDLVDDNRVYIVNQSKIELVEVNNAGYNGDFAIIQGLKDGTRVVTEKFEGIKDGFEINPPAPAKEENQQISKF
jgi:multidrug efflux pump subunit AcrA (membrane-fusion protein)